MAIAVPPCFVSSHPATYLSDHHRHQRDEHHPSWRLPLHHQQDIKDVAMGVEETNAGVCTRYLLDELERQGPTTDDGVALLEAERWCDRYHVFAHPSVRTWRNRIARCKRAIRAMRRAEGSEDSRRADVLHVAYGYPDPMTRAFTKPVLEFWGELASLARYTGAAEERRQKLVRHELALSSACSASVVDLADMRRREEQLDRIVSSADAVRDALAPFTEDRPRKETGELPEVYRERCRPHEERSVAHGARRAAFLSAARADADRMLSEASRAYNMAWLAAGA